MAGTRSPGEPSGASDVWASLSYRSNWLDGIVERRKIGPNFNPEVGFIERTDSNETSGDLTFKVRPKTKGVREVQFEGFILHAPDTRNVVQTQEWQGTIRVDFNNGAFTDDDIVDVFPFPRPGTASGCPRRMEILRSRSQTYKGTIRLASS
ncbi:MAG TPA: hypothetical protein VGT24_05410 [Candidatus Acidoferrales bacterium]|nr:hypothetical protein [Candidatus Acidoferrales bacterium]